MDLDARTSCLRALAIIARSARLCACDIESWQYQSSVEGAERALVRAQKHYEDLSAAHAAHERPVRLCAQAVTVGRECIAKLLELPTDEEAAIDHALALEAAAGKLERALDRAGSPPTEPPGEKG